MKNRKGAYMKRFIGVLGAVFFALLASACDTALGAMVNLKGPVVKITGPAFTNGFTDIAVKELFELRGSISGDNDITRVEVKMSRYDNNSRQTLPVGREWRYEGAWQYREDSGKSWKTYTESDYESSVSDPGDPPAAPAWIRSGNAVNWTLPVTLAGLETGEYFITVGAWDSAGNHDANSTEKTKVVYDNNMPKFRVRDPFLLPDDTGSPPENPSVPAKFKEYIYDPLNRPAETHRDIRRWVNRSVDFSWEIEKDMIPGADGLPYRLSFEFTNKHNIKDPSSREPKELYYRYEWPDNSKNPEAFGIFTDGNVPGGFFKAGGAIKGADIKPRNEAGNPIDGESLPADEATYIQVVSTLKGAGNLEHKSQGWFAYLPDSDKPWADIKFGHKVDPKKIPANAPDLAYIWTGRTYEDNVIYDNDGIKSVDWTLYKLKDSGLEDDTGFTPISGHDDFDDDTGKAGWTFTADTSYGIGRFRIKVRATDINGVPGDTYHAYFTIENNSTPTIREAGIYKPDHTPVSAGSAGIPLFGDSKGDFVIEGYAQIEDAQYTGSGSPEVKVERVTVVWINPNPATSAESQLSYQDRAYTEWEKGKSKPGPRGYYQDSSGNRVWELPAPVFIKGTGEHGQNDNKQYDWKFSKTLNVFKDLDIKPGENPSGGQTFLIRVWSRPLANTPPRSTVYTPIKTLGDSKPPELSIEKLIFTKYNELSGGYETPESYYAPFRMLPVIGKNDKVKIQGTWTDDSFEAWNGIPALERLAFFREKLALSWDLGDGSSLPFEGCKLYADNSLNLPGAGNRPSWETGDLIFAEKNRTPIVLVRAALTDHNNNKGGAETTFIVETDNPTLIRISSETSDGVYGDNKDTKPPNAPPDRHYIDIFLEFNKQVKFFDTAISSYDPPNPEMVPCLRLNNGGRAFYVFGNGDNKLRFRYFVDGKVDHTGYTDIPAARPNFGGTSTYDPRGKNDPEGEPRPLVSLNVEEIVWSVDYPSSSLLGVESGDAVIMPPSVFDSSSVLSLARGKNIIIDKDKPEIKSIVSSAGDMRHHGKGSPIYITVNFDNPVTVSGYPDKPSRVKPGNFYLRLKGGNLGNRPVPASALFAGVAGASSVSFRYDVLDGDDTSNNPASPYLEIASLVAGAELSITDQAGNIFTQPLTLPGNGKLNKNLVIDTTPPAVPAVTGIEAKTYYSYQKFNIEGLEGRDVTVQYSLNYDPNNPENDKIVWETVDLSNYPITENGNGWAIKGIDLKVNGSYTIAARQFDNATTPNRSENPPATGTVGTAGLPVRIDAVPVLTRLGSSTPDGVYGAGQKINIDLIFRIPVYIRSGLPRQAYIQLNVENKDNERAGCAYLRNTPPPRPVDGSKIWTFEYIVQEGDLAETLDVGKFYLTDFLEFYDAPEKGTRLNDWITLDGDDTNHKFSAQKKITVLSGYPAAKNADVSISPGASDPVSAKAVNFYKQKQGNGYRLDIEFDRDIFRGDTGEPLIIKQIKGAESQTASNSGYRIPAVLTEREWSALFINRTDLAAIMPAAWGASPAARVQAWRDLGEQYYRKGTNGAKLSGGADSLLIPDTAIKYVLRYDIDPLKDDTGTPKNVGAVKGILREAEALRFNAHDKEVSIAADAEGRPRILRIELAADKALPVPGAKYQWKIPNGFVKDFLEKPNGRSFDGYDPALTSGDPEEGQHDANPMTLVLDGSASPVIRINKGEDGDTIGSDRQARQPLESEVRIDCRTPGKSLEYRKRQTTDNVGRLIMRSNPGRITGSSGNITENRALPNLGSQIPNDTTTFNAAKLRPQSGNKVNPLSVPGLDFWVPMNSRITAGTGPEYSQTRYPDGFTNYSAPFSIGSNNYNDGGMEVNIHARVKGNEAAGAYEAAYRSVFVFNNAVHNGNRTLDIDTNGGGPQSTFQRRDLGRMWIRGGDSATGDPSVPDFPISRNRTLWRKARLMTPLSVSEGQLISTTTPITDANGIPTGYNQNGKYIWIWVTWRINVEHTYIDPFCGQLPESKDDAYQTPRFIKDFYQAYIPFKEHYPMIRGRTTVIEPRAPKDANGNGYNLIDGTNGELSFGTVETSPSRAD